LKLIVLLFLFFKAKSIRFSGLHKNTQTLRLSPKPLEEAYLNPIRGESTACVTVTFVVSSYLLVKIF
ncbi:hypothetical protein D9O36_21175, partial [Zobellia amurskyensis]|nr:hypothetical protein [Zobellia amurskyensis]